MLQRHNRRARRRHHLRCLSLVTRAIAPPPLVVVVTRGVGPLSQRVQRVLQISAYAALAMPKVDALFKALGSIRRARGVDSVKAGQQVNTA